MAIMDMAMVKNAKPLLILTLFGAHAYAAESEINVSGTLKETYSDNVTLVTVDQQDSHIQSASVAISSKVKSKALTLDLDSNYTQLFYSHDSDANKGYESLSAKARFAPWLKGPALTLQSRIANTPRSFGENARSDLISGGTVRTNTYSVGLQQNVTNSDFNFNSNINFTDASAEDNIGESNGYGGNIRFTNGISHKHVFWDVYGNYSDRKNDAITARSFRTEAKLGLISSWKFNPFIRYYNEDYTGTISDTSSNQGESWGAGIRWQPARNIELDISYNFVKDKTLTDDYVDAKLSWDLSPRTKVRAGYSQRFFGDSYSLSINHKNRRLSNVISYNEEIQAFQRDSFETFVAGTLFCPINQPVNAENCLRTADNIDDINQFIQVPITGVRPFEDNRFSLFKTLSWNSTLTLSKTTFSLVLSNREREELTTGITQDFLSSRLSANRKLSGRSSATLTWSYTRNNYTAFNEPASAERRDYYRSYSLSYNRTLTSTLSLDISMRYLDRLSNIDFRTYEETRANIAIRKDF